MSNHPSGFDTCMRILPPFDANGAGLSISFTEGHSNPSLSYTKALELQVASLEQALAQAKAGESNGSAGVPPGASASPDVSSEQDASSAAQDVEFASHFQGLKVDSSGRVSFHGPTSFFHLASGSPTQELPHPLSTDDVGKARLINNAWTARAFERLSNHPVRVTTWQIPTSAIADITLQKPVQYLLDSHWCWIQPLFNFIYRPAFTRDMKENGAYYSDTLLNAVLSHSVRWCRADPDIALQLEPYEGGAYFGQQARHDVMTAVQSGPATIPTIQTLLLLSAQECGRGSLTQAWLYSGMAFRLIEDLGIVFDGRRYAGTAQFSTEDIEIRNRLFWACYFWDKLISLYLGRLPTFQHSRVSPPRSILDDTGEIDIWTPHGIDPSLAVAYPPMQAHSTSCFIHFCGLAEILNVVLVTLYNPLQHSKQDQTIECVTQQGRRLDEWYNGLPDFLRIPTPHTPTHCPPCHIVTLNCLYYTINILLHRPMLTVHHREGDHSGVGETDHLRQCIQSATATITIFDLYVRSFGDGHVVTCQAYTVYTAASVFLLHVQATKDVTSTAMQNLRYCIHALERLKDTSPVISSALSLIYKELQGFDAANRGAASEDALHSSIFEPLSPNNDGHVYFTPSSNGVAHFEDSQVIDFNFDTIEFTPEMFDAMSSIEPISANVNAGFDMHTTFGFT